MTQRRNDPDRLSNYFDRLLHGIGHRGSSFTDVDALTHDEGPPDRFLFQEFKGSNEPLNTGQARLLKGLARQNYITVWCVRRLTDINRLQWCDVASRQAGVVTVEHYQAMFRAWWMRAAVVPEFTVPALREDTELLTADDINWGFSDPAPARRKVS